MSTDPKFLKVFPKIYPRAPKILPSRDRNFRYLITPDPAGSDPSNNYINAVFGESFLTRRDIIITQMPLPHTVGDFWRLIHDYNVSVVVMLNDKTENDDSTHQYWPEEGKFFSNITGTFGGSIKVCLLYTSPSPRDRG